MRLPDIASSVEPIKISMQIIASYAHYLPAAPYREIYCLHIASLKNRARTVLNQDTKLRRTGFKITLKSLRRILFYMFTFYI